jgi:hypothetical protein
VLDHDSLLKRTQPLAPLTQASAIIYSAGVTEGDPKQVRERTPEDTSNLMELFFYLPPVSWLQALAPLQGTNSSFDIAMSALSMVRFGRQSGNEKLRREGLTYYGKALEGLQKVLSNEELVFEEQTLAASMTLSVFEVYFRFSNSQKIGADFVRYWRFRERVRMGGSVTLKEFRGSSN